ncbi:MAG: hypothetical protein OWS74_06545 [Firmicutes bacterium]|nr:hypothetical protein [Bacillota bacterium]
MSYRPFVDRFVGAVGIVEEFIPANREGSGVVQVAGQLWSAVTDEKQGIEMGVVVLILERRRTQLIVMPLPPEPR